MASKQEMLGALKATVIPWLRTERFTGSFPHFRKIGETDVKLLTFQFSQWGGRFVVEYVRAPVTGWDKFSDDHIEPKQLRIVNIVARNRVKMTDGSSEDYWFDFERVPPAKIARDLLEKISQPGFWDVPIAKPL